MKTFPLELSPQVRQGRYANFSRATDSADHIFMAGYEECAPDYFIERSDFPFWTLEVVVGGHGSFREGRQLRRLRHGSVFTHGPGVVQHFGNEAERPFRKYFFVRGGAPFPKAWQAVGLRPGKVLQLGDVASLVGILDKIVDEGQQSDVQTAQVVDGLEAVLLALIARHQGSASGEKSASRVVYDLAMEILLREYKSLHALSDLAERSGYSSEYLCRIFKKYHGESPYQVLLHRKMSAAWLLLRDGQLQVGAVGRELGYEDPLHFSRVFRKIMGCTPSSVGAR
jgi:AraC-like DNA-binding protein